MTNTCHLQLEEQVRRGEEILSKRQTPAAVQAQDLALCLGGRTLWSNAQLTIRPGEFVTVVGPNGAGKTSLLRLLLGLLHPGQGMVQVFGREPRRGNSLIGYVPQRRTLSPDLSIRAEDFVQLGLDGHQWGISLSGFSRRQRAQRDQQVQEVLAAVGATGYAHRSVGKLSGGEQQRLLLAQALLGHPSILLLDEPLASLDLRHQGMMAQLVAQIAQARQITVILVAHDVNPLLPSIDRVLYIARGQVAIGSPDEIITTECLSQIYDAPIEVVRDSRGRVLVFGLEMAG